MPSAISLVEITDLYDDHLLPWLTLYEHAFPRSERVLVSSLLASVKQRRDQDPQRIGGEIMLAVLDAAECFAGLLQYEHFRESGAAALWYFAIEPERRNQGLGSLAYRLLLDRVTREGARALVIEVEIPDDAPGPREKEWAERRIRFYRRFGARLLVGVDHQQKVDDDVPAIPMYVLVQPLEPLDAEESFVVAKAALGESITRSGALALA